MPTDRFRSDSVRNQSQPATLAFLTGWRNMQQADIVRGQKLTIDYDPDRLPHCRLNWHGAEVWDIAVFIKFHPGGQLFTGSVLEKILDPPERGMVVRLTPKRYEVTVPMNATRVEIWFRNYYQVMRTCEAWDSQFGRNYCYDVVHD